MRNVPLQFVDEAVLNRVREIQDRERRAEAIARPLGLQTRILTEHWAEIERHKWFLSQQLGRDVGSNVAVLDYFENVKGQPIDRVQNWLARVWGKLLQNLDGDGPRSLAHFERAMQGTRSLAR